MTTTTAMIIMVAMISNNDMFNTESLSDITMTTMITMTL